MHSALKSKKVPFGIFSKGTIKLANGSASKILGIFIDPLRALLSFFQFLKHWNRSGATYLVDGCNKCVDEESDPWYYN